jgi:hypothetical protein
MSYCKNCGVELNLEDRFCSKCGTEIKKNESDPNNNYLFSTLKSKLFLSEDDFKYQPNNTPSGGPGDYEVDIDERKERITFSNDEILLLKKSVNEDFSFEIDSFPELIYFGQFQNGLKHGFGTTIYLYDNTIQYSGNWIKGDKSGFGIIIGLGHRPRYVGEWSDGKYDGCGKLIDNEGVWYYEGEFKNGKFHGNGIASIYGGDKYEGEFKNGKFHGNGVLYDEDGEVVIKGEWIEGELTNEEENKIISKPIEKKVDNQSPLDPRDGAGIR